MQCVFDEFLFALSTVDCQFIVVMYPANDFPGVRVSIFIVLLIFGERLFISVLELSTVYCMSLLLLQMPSTNSMTNFK